MGVGPISASDEAVPRKTAYDLTRLEGAVAELVERFQALQRENQKLREELSEQRSRNRSLEAKVLEGNQRRQDVAKRLDDLVAQIDYLDGQLARG